MADQAQKQYCSLYYTHWTQRLLHHTAVLVCNNLAEHVGDSVTAWFSKPLKAEFRRFVTALLSGKTAAAAGIKAMQIQNHKFKRGHETQK